LVAVSVLLALTGLVLVALTTRGEGPPPAFFDLTFPGNGQVLEEGEVVIAGSISAPNGLSQGPVLRRRNLTLRSWDEVRLNIAGPEHSFDISYEWPDRILQAGDVVLTLTATDDAGLSTSISSTVTVTPNQAILALDSELNSISQQRGAELSALYSDMGQFLSRCQQFSFDSELATIWSTLVQSTSASGLSQSNPWKPHLAVACNAVASLSPPDEVAARIKSDTLAFLDGFYDYAETQNNNYLTWIPAPDVDLPLLQQSINAYDELAISSSVNGNLGQFGMARGQRELFSLSINLGTIPPAVAGSVYGVPLSDEQKLHPILATQPVIDDVYLATEFDLLQNTRDKGGI